MSNDEEEKGYRVIDRRSQSWTAANEPVPFSEEAIIRSGDAALALGTGVLPPKWSEERFSQMCDRIRDEGVGAEPEFLRLPDVPPEMYRALEAASLRARLTAGGMTADQAEELVISAGLGAPSTDEPQAEHTLERAPESKPVEPKPESKSARKRRLKRELAIARAAAGRKLSFKAQQEEVEDEGDGPLDPITFIGVVANNMNQAIAKNERARARLPGSERMHADELQMAAQVAFCLAYMEHYGPASEQDRLRILSIAQDQKKLFKFKSAKGSIVQPKKSGLILESPPLIIPG